MKIIRHDQPDFEAALAPLFQRTAFDPEIEHSVARILEEVRRRGDAAVAEFAKTFDHVALTPGRFRVSQEEIAAAEQSLPLRARQAIRLACRQVRNYAARQLPRAWSDAARRGVVLGERFEPLDRVGAYIPGGTAPLVSTVIHTVALAAVAQVPEIVVATPPRPDGTVHPAILFAAQTAGAAAVYRLGGVYAIAALAFGTETIQKVEKIVGPGNAYVTAAKRQVYGHTALDLVAGPSEIMILADDTADPRFIAADMLSQAEHGSGREQAVLVATREELLQSVAAELERQAGQRNRRDIIRNVLETGTFLILVDSIEAAAGLASRYAPEHLEIMTRKPGTVAKKVRAAGAVFLGPWTPEPVGDFVAGPSHVLPTGGAARFFSGLTVRHFFRRISVVHYQKSALEAEAPAIAEFAALEGLDAHGASVAIRFAAREEEDSP